MPNSKNIFNALPQSVLRTIIPLKWMWYSVIYLDDLFCDRSNSPTVPNFALDSAFRLNDSDSGVPLAAYIVVIFLYDYNIDLFIKVAHISNVWEQFIFFLTSRDIYHLYLSIPLLINDAPNFNKWCVEFQ